MEKTAAEAIRNTAPMFEFIKSEMRAAARRNDDVVVQFLRMQMFLIDEAMFTGYREARTEGNNERKNVG